MGNSMGPLLIIFGYLIGAFPTGYLMGILWGRDLRKEGYRKISASNVHKVLNIWVAIPVAIIDLLKGFIPVYIGKVLGVELIYLEIAGVASIVGHNYPVYLRFKGGGRGIATASGMLLCLLPKEFLIGAVLFLSLTLIMGSSPIPTIITFIFLPILAVIFKEPLSIILTLVFIFIFIMITRVIAGYKEIKEASEKKKVFLRRLLYDR